MHSATSFLILAITAICALAVPTPSRPLVKRSFAVPVKGHAKLAPADAMAQAYRKYGWEIIIIDPQQAAAVSSAPAYGSNPPQSSSAPPAPAATDSESSGSSGSSTASWSSAGPSPSGSPTGSGGDGAVTATPEKSDSEYLSPVSIGGQTLTLDFDTGSADLWVFSTKLSASESSGHTVFNPSKSPTWSNLNGAEWQIQYGDGSTASGSVGYDTVNVGGASVSKQAVELAEDVSGDFRKDVQSDGLLGLAFSSINTVTPQPQKTFFENIMNHLDKPVFTADLGDSDGIYEFGAIDSSKYTGSIHYTAVDNSQGFWGFESNSVTINGKQHPVSSSSMTIADTGTSIILMDDDVVSAYYANVQGVTNSEEQGGYVYPCSGSLPDFGVAIGSSYTATVKGADMKYAEISPGLCYGGLQSNGGASINIMGDVLLKNFFVVFDGGHMQIGFAEKP